MVKRLIRSTEPLGRAAGLISGYLLVLSGSQTWSIVSDFYSRLNFGGEMRSSKDFLDDFKKLMMRNYVAIPGFTAFIQHAGL